MAPYLDRARLWLREEPISRAVMDAVWLADYGVPYEPTVDTYRDAVRLAMRHLWDEGDVPAPAWASEVVESGFSAIGMRMIDAVMFHALAMGVRGTLLWGMSDDPVDSGFGNVFLRPGRRRTVAGVPGSFARVADGRIGLSILEKPLRRTGLADEASGAPLSDREFNPRRARGAGNVRWLKRASGRRMWEIAIPEPLDSAPDISVGAEADAPLTVDELLATVKPSELAPAFTHQLWLDESAESEWGSERFEGYGSRLAAQDGVEDVLWEDRELIHVRAPELDDAAVLSAARRAAAH